MAYLNEESKKVVRRYLTNIAKNVLKVDFDSFSPNPILGAILTNGLGFNKERAFRFMVEQRFERSIVTSVGNMFQAIAKTLAAKATGVEGADVQVQKNGLTYFIQIKSGPTTVNKDIASEISRKLGSAVRRHGRAVAVLGICYGSEKQLWPWAKDYNLQVKVGDDFWKFISNNDVSLCDVINLVQDISSESQFRDLSTEVDKKFEELLNSFAKKYAPKGIVDWTN